MGTNLTHSFTRNTSYYTGTVYEWNLPTGTTCPFADECKVTVNRITGWFKINKRGRFKCYAASAERYPAVRASRWQNYEYVKRGGVPVLPTDARRCAYTRLATFTASNTSTYGCNLRPKIQP
jgi:hypothetical protein